MSETLDQPKGRSKPSRIVGLDYGMARIGVALSDEQKILATSLKTMTTEKKLEATATKVVEELVRHSNEAGYLIEKIVIGLPLMMSGKKGLLADEVEHFVVLLKERMSVPIILWDERLSSVQADRSMREGNMTRRQRSKRIDAVAAVIILQSYLYTERD